MNGLNGSTPQGPQAVDADVYAAYLWEFYGACQRRGFDKKQAFELVTIAMRAAAMIEVGTP